MCFHLCKPLICYLFITTTFQIIVDFMTKWNRGFKSLFFSCWTLYSAWVWVWLNRTSWSSSSDGPSEKFRLVFSIQISEVTPRQLQYSFFISLLSDWDVDHSSKFSCKHQFRPIFSLKTQLTASYCALQLFRQHIDSGEVVGEGKLSALTLMERHRFYGARLYWPVADIYFLVS